MVRQTAAAEALAKKAESATQSFAIAPRYFDDTAEQPDFSRSDAECAVWIAQQIDTHRQHKPWKLCKGQEKGNKQRR